MTKITESVLSSPILLDEVKELLTIIRGETKPMAPGWRVPPRLIKIAESLPASVIIKARNMKVLEPLDYHLFFRLRNNQPEVANLLQASVRDTQRLMGYSRQALSRMWSSQSGLMDSPTHGWNWLREGDIQDTLLDMFRASSYWMSIETLSSFALATKPLSWIQIQISEGECYVNGEFLIISSSQFHHFYLLTWDQVLMFKDLTFSRFVCGIYAQHNQAGSFPGINLSQLIWLLQWQESCIKTLGNNGYVLIKGIEPLFKTSIFQMREELLEDDLLPVPNMLVKLRLREQAMTGNTQFIDQLDEFRISLSGDMRALADAFGTMKLSGHPVVMPISGLEKVKKIATQELNISPEAIQNVRRHFCHMFSRGFLKKHKRLPSLRFLHIGAGTPKSSLERLSARPEPILNLSPDNYSISDWDLTRFGPEYSFDEGEDFLALISDKAISSLRSEIWETWKERTIEQIPRLTTSRRALLEVLQREQFRVGDIIKVVRDRRVPHDMFIVCVFPKEREMKPDPRMFAMLPLDMRTFLVNLEHNIANGIFRDTPQQTMTMSYLDLKRRFIELSEGRNLEHDPYWTVNLEVDLSSWNIFMRSETITPICRDLDDLYGQDNVFTFVHEFFNRSLICLRHPSYPPDIPVNIRADPAPSNVAYGGGSDQTPHQGGEEGLFQKGWTEFTLAMITADLTKYGVEFELIGQGDNQVIVMKLPRSRYPTKIEVSKFCREVLASLQSSCAAVGHTVKPDECILSTSGFSYGKEIILDGAVIPSTLKAISRIMPSRTQDTPTTSSSFSGIWSDGLAATEKTDKCNITYMITNLVASLTLRRELTASPLHGSLVGESFYWGLMTPAMQSDLVLLLLTLPINLGGLAAGNLINFLYKGTADPLVQSLTAVSLLSEFPQTKRIMGWLKDKTGISADPDITHLLEEPYSIPLQRAPNPAYALKKEVESRLSGINDNLVIQQILDLSGAEGKQEFVDWIQSLTPFHPKVFHDLYEASPYVEVDKFSSRFTNTRTIIQKAGNASISTAGLMIAGDLAYWQDVAKRIQSIFKSRPQDVFTDMVGKLASDLRLSWGVGPMEDIGASSPLSCCKIFRSSSEIIQNACDGIIVALMPPTTKPDRQLTRGPFDPYLGGSTLPKQTDRGVHIVSSSPPIDKAIKIIQIRNIVSQEGSRAWSDISLWAKARTSIDLHWIEAAAPRMYGGNVAHRYSTSSMPEGATLNATFNLSSHLQFSSDYSDKLGSGELDKKLSYQELYMLMRTMISLISPGDMTAGGTFILQLDLANVAEVSSTLIPLSGNPSPNPPVLPVNYYLRSDSIKVAAKTESSLFWRGARYGDLSSISLNQYNGRMVRESIRALMLDAMTRKREVIRSLNSPGRVSVGQSIIDVPESKCLYWHELLEATALSCIDMTLVSSVRLSRPNPSILNVANNCFLLSQRIAVALYGIICQSLPYLKGDIPSGCLPGPGYYGHQRSASVFAHCVATKALGIITHLNRSNVASSLKSAFSSSLGSESNLVLNNILLWLLSGGKEAPLSFKHALVVSKFKLKIYTEGLTEDESLALLDPYATLMKLNKWKPLQVYESSPNELLRTLRGRLNLKDYREKVPGCKEITQPIPALLMDRRHRTIGGKFNLSLQHSRTKSELIKSLIRRNIVRPFATLSSAAYTWFPVLSEAGSRCAVVGVGSGGIVNLLNRNSIFVTGFDQSSVLLSQREHFTQYRPSLCNQPELYRTHPYSWLTSGDITKHDFTSAFAQWCAHNQESLVIIDVEGVDLHKRLEFYNFVIQCGCRAAVKLFLPGRALLLTAAISAQSYNLKWWPNPACPEDEIIVIGSTIIQTPLSNVSESTLIPVINDYCWSIILAVNICLDSTAVDTHHFLYFEIFKQSPRHVLWKSRSKYQDTVRRLGRDFRGNRGRLISLLFLVGLIEQEQLVSAAELPKALIRLVSRLAGLIMFKRSW
jgi:hypothetical protein